MCSIHEGFKLCSCEGEINFDAEGIYWILSRINPAKELVQRKGKVVLPRYNAQEEDQRTLILTELNKQNCFDFDFTPRLNDFLKITIEFKNHSQRYCFQYTNNQWIVNSCDNLQGWKSQLDRWKSGKLE